MKKKKHTFVKKELKNEISQRQKLVRDRKYISKDGKK